MAPKQIIFFTEGEALALYGCTWALYIGLAIAYSYIRRDFLWPLQKKNWLTFFPLISLFFESMSVLLQYLTFINTFAVTCYAILNIGPGNFLLVGYLARFFFAARLYKIFGDVSYPAKYLKAWVGTVVACFLILFIILYVDLHVTNKELWEEGNCANIVFMHTFAFYPYCAMVISTIVDFVTCGLFIYPVIQNIKGASMGENTLGQISKNRKQFSLVIVTTIMCVLSTAVSLANNIQWLGDPPLDINLIYAESLINGISPCFPTIIQEILTKLNCCGLADSDSKTRTRHTTQSTEGLNPKSQKSVKSTQPVSALEGGSSTFDNTVRSESVHV